MHDNYKSKGQRKELVELLISKGISDSNVLKAIGTVPRHVFFESSFHQFAYQDKAFPIGEGQTISQPYTVAFQSQLLEIKPGDKILEVGTGSGYQCSVLIQLGAKVFSIERNLPLHKKSAATLDKLKLKAKLFCGDGTKGLPSFAPFDKIIVTAGAPVIPDSLIDQLKPNGKLVIPVGNHTTQKMVLLKKVDNKKVIKKVYGDFSFVPLIGTKGWEESK